MKNRSIIHGFILFSLLSVGCTSLTNPGYRDLVNSLDSFHQIAEESQNIRVDFTTNATLHENNDITEESITFFTIIDLDDYYLESNIQDKNIVVERKESTFNYYYYKIVYTLFETITEQDYHTIISLYDMGISSGVYSVITPSSIQYNKEGIRYSFQSSLTELDWGYVNIIENLMQNQGLTEDQLNEINLNCYIECDPATKKLLFSFGADNVINPTTENSYVDFVCEVNFVFDQPYIKKVAPDYLAEMISPFLDTTYQVHQYSDQLEGFILKDYGGYLRVYFTEGNYTIRYITISRLDSCELFLRSEDHPIPIEDKSFHIESSGVYILSISSLYNQAIQVSIQKTS